MPDDRLSRVDSNSERIMSVSHSVPEIFDVKDAKMHDVIKLFDTEVATRMKSLSSLRRGRVRR